MEKFQVPQRKDVSAANQLTFDKLTEFIGNVPNLYATFALSNYALSTYLALQHAKTSLNAKQKEIINLVVSQVNDCSYCLSAHTEIAILNDFSTGQIAEIRRGSASFDPKFHALAGLVKSITENNGRPDAQLLENFFQAGYTKENLVDTIMVIGDKIISNYLCKITDIPIDFPLASPLSVVPTKHYSGIPK